MSILQRKLPMPDEMLVKHCSPTLAGLKTGNLFSVMYESKMEMNQAIRMMNQRLADKGLRMIPLRYKDGKALIYLYRPSLLEKNLADAEAVKLMQESGYEQLTSSRCIARLISRLMNTDEFPHEIGLFLGYPPEDVRGFIENHANNYSCSGCWKVYGDKEKARCTFARFKKCTDIYCELLRKGRSVEQLAVAV